MESSRVRRLGRGLSGETRTTTPTRNGRRTGPGGSMSGGSGNLRSEYQPAEVLLPSLDLRSQSHVLSQNSTQPPAWSPGNDTTITTPRTTNLFTRCASLSNLCMLSKPIHAKSPINQPLITHNSLACPTVHPYNQLAIRPASISLSAALTQFDHTLARPLSSRSRSRPVQARASGPHFIVGVFTSSDTQFLVSSIPLNGFLEASRWT